MKRKLIRTLGFFLGLYVLILICSNVFSDKDDEDYVFDKTSVRVKAVEINQEAEKSLQVLFVGDSVCYSSFSPQILWDNYGITSYIGASSAQRLCDGYAIAKETYDNQDPKVVVLETTCLYRKIEIEKENNDFVLNIFNKKLPLIQRHSDWKEYADRAVKVKTKMEKSSMKGFVPRYNVNPYTNGDYMIESDIDEEISEDVLEYLNKLKRLCDEHGTLFLLVSTPSPRNWNYERHNAVDSWARENKVEYLDLNLYNELGIDWANDTKDGGDHLNVYGAEKTSLFIGQHLVDKYFVNDYREDENFKDWLPIKE